MDNSREWFIEWALQKFHAERIQQALLLTAILALSAGVALLFVVAALMVLDGYFLLGMGVLCAPVAFSYSLRDLIAGYKKMALYKHAVVLADRDQINAATAFCETNHMTFILKEGPWPLYTFRRGRDAVLFKLMFG